MRTISPYIAFLLMVLLLSGSMGFTLIRHTCQYCGTEQFFASVTPLSDDEYCCCHEKGDIQNQTDNSEMMISDDCCSHESERMVTDELVRTEVQNEIVPYFLAAAVVAVIPEHSQHIRYTYSCDRANYGIRDLTTMLCQIIS
jgi:hypothetical protein